MAPTTDFFREYADPNENYTEGLAAAVEEAKLEHTSPVELAAIDLIDFATGATRDILDNPDFEIEVCGLFIDRIGTSREDTPLCAMPAVRISTFGTEKHGVLAFVTPRGIIETDTFIDETPVYIPRIEYTSREGNTRVPPGSVIKYLTFPDGITEEFIQPSAVGSISMPTAGIAIMEENKDLLIKRLAAGRKDYALQRIKVLRTALDDVLNQRPSYRYEGPVFPELPPKPKKKFLGFFKA